MCIRKFADINQSEGNFLPSSPPPPPRILFSLWILPHISICSMFSWINIFQFVILYSANDWKLETTFNVNLILSMKSFIWERPSHCQSRRLHIIGFCPIFLVGTIDVTLPSKMFSYGYCLFVYVTLTLCYSHFLLLFDYFGSLNEIINLYRISEQSFIFRFSQHSINHVGLHASLFFYTYKYTGIIIRHSKRKWYQQMLVSICLRMWSIFSFFFQYSRQNQTTVDCRQLFWLVCFYRSIILLYHTESIPKMPETWEYFGVSSRAATSTKYKFNQWTCHLFKYILVAAE